MACLEDFLRLLLVFPVVGVVNLYACQAAAVTNVSSQNAEQNLTQSSPSLFILKRQQRHWESPASTLSLSHHVLNNAVRSGASVLRLSEEASLQSNSQAKKPTINERVADSISYSVLRFALEIGTQLSENAYYSKNEVFSPLSLMTALSLLLAGAKGKSYQQLKPIFGFDLDDELMRSPNYAQLMHKEFGNLLQDIEQQSISNLHYPNNAKWRDTPAHYNIRVMSPKLNEPIQHIIKVANGLFAQKDYNLNKNYRDVITTIYGAEVDQLDYRVNNDAARQKINGWVSKNTFGKIPSIISNAIPQGTNMILASVLYFKAFWENTFFEAATALDNFYPEGETKPAIKVQMMATGGLFPYYDATELNCRIIGLPYKGNLTTMYIIQPRQSSRANLKELQSKITAELINDMISKMVYRTAIVAFPKIHVDRQLNMKEILKHFGVTDIFSSGVSDLSLIGGVQQNVQSAPAFQQWHENKKQFAMRPEVTDRFNEPALVFSSRFGEIGNETNIDGTAENITNDDNTSETSTITPPKKEEESESECRKKRQLLSNVSPINLLEAERLVSSSSKSDLYVEDILHKVNFEVNEQGTEAAAATLTYLRRSGTDITFRADTPFILLIRHDPSKLILFYGIINEPES